MEKNLTTKAGVLTYLQDAKAIEKDIYALEQMEKELKKRASEIQQKAEKDAKDAVEQCEQDLQQLKCNEPTLRVIEKEPMSSMLGNAFGAGGCCAFFGVIIGAIIGTFFVTDAPDDKGYAVLWGLLIGGGVCLLVGFIGGLIYHISKNKEVPRLNRWCADIYREQRNDYEEEVAAAQAELAEARKKCHISSPTVEYYNKQLQCLRQNLASLYANRKKFYSVGVVPPDYRTMDCVYVLEQIFRNDLADTMREAVLLYEERVFRGEVIRGMQNITNQLGDLSSLMSALRTDITLVGCDVSRMRDDMVHIYEQNRSFAADVARSNDRLYEETKLHRYAVEAIQQSNQKIVDYLEE